MQGLPLGPLLHRRRHHLVLLPLPPVETPARRLRLTVLLSLGLHLALIAALLLWSSHWPPQASGPQSEGAVELVLVEHSGAGSPAAPAEPMPPAPVQTQPAPPAPPVPPPPDSVATLPAPPVPASQSMPQAEAAEQPLPPPTPPTAPKTAPSQSPLEQEAPQISLGSDETEAIALGPHVIPASIDAKYHNREPVYPPDAARRSEQGTVILLIHVSPDGLAASVDVAQTSGVASLDRAARDAVLTWRFLPAIRDGIPIGFDMPLRVVFHLQ